MNILRLGILEVRRYRRGPLGRAAVVAMILLPLLYGCVYLVAFWNPYNNLNKLPVALVNLDQPVVANGQTINVGQQLTQTLVSGHQFNWTVINQQSAAKGLGASTYYMVLTIPANTSANIASLAGNNPIPAQLQLTTNNANNYLVSLIAQQAAAQISSGLTQQVDSQFASTTLSGIQTIRGSLQTAATGAQQLVTGINQAQTGSTQLQTGAAQIAAGNAVLATAANTANSVINVATTDVNNVVARAQAYAAANPTNQLAQDVATALNDIKTRLGTLTTTVQGDIAKINELSNGSQQLSTGVTSLSSGLQQLAIGSTALSSGLQQGVASIPSYTPAQEQAVAAMVANPVNVNDQSINASSSYGTGFAPYFMPMALWVGTLVALMLFTPLPKKSRLSQRLSSAGIALTGLIPMFVVGLAQVIVLTSVLYLFVGVHSVFPMEMFGVTLLASLVFVLIINFLMAFLGIAGKLVALVILMLQLCSSGGTYPIELSPGFFQNISPFLPMTYAVDALRRSINGGELGSVVFDCEILAIFGIIAFILTVILARRKRVFTMDDLKPELVI